MQVSRHHHRIARVLAVGLAVTAVAAPAASGRPASLDQPVVIEPEPAPVVQTIDNGFDWDSAAIGAGGAGALLLLVALGGPTLRSRHDHDIRVSS